MSGWPNIALGSCVREMRGGASVTDDDLKESGFPVLHKGAIREGGRLVFDRDGKSHVSEEYATSKARSVVTSKFVVATLRNLVKTGETLGFIAPVPSGQKFLLAQGAYGLLLDDKRLDRRYLSHLSNSWVFHKEILKRMVGSTQVHIRNNDFLQVPIPLPPLEEQRRIAEVLDRADALRQKRRLALQKLDTLLQSVFLDIFGDPVKNPRGWPQERMGDLMVIRRGGSPRPIDDYLGGEINWIKIGDATKGDQIYLDSSKEKIISEGLKKTVFLKSGSLIFANCGVSLGFARILRIDGCIHDGWLSFEEIPEKRLNKIFLLKALNSITDHFRRIAPSGTQPNLNTGIMKTFPMIVPPIDVQTRFAEIVANIEKIRPTIGASETAVENLFGSVQDRAFKGDLAFEST